MSLSFQTVSGITYIEKTVADNTKYYVPVIAGWPKAMQLSDGDNFNPSQSLSLIHI